MNNKARCDEFSHICVGKWEPMDELDSIYCTGSTCSQMECCNWNEFGDDEPRKICNVWGDPHIRSFDGVPTFNLETHEKQKDADNYSPGDFWMLKVADQFLIQARLKNLNEGQLSSMVVLAITGTYTGGKLITVNINNIQIDDKIFPYGEMTYQDDFIKIVGSSDKRTFTVSFLRHPGTSVHVREEFRGSRGVKRLTMDMSVVGLDPFEVGGLCAGGKNIVSNTSAVAAAERLIRGPPPIAGVSTHISRDCTREKAMVAHEWCITHGFDAGIGGCNDMDYSACLIDHCQGMQDESERCTAEGKWEAEVAQQMAEPNL